MADADLLFATHRDGVFRYLSRIVGTNDASDLTQEVFLRVARHPVPQESPESQRVWVFRIARNLALNHRRDTHRRPIAVELKDTAVSPGQELAIVVQEALNQLTPEDRDTFLLREAAGLSYEEIAAACDTSVAAVRSRLHRARLKLRASLTTTLLPSEVRLHDKS